MNTSMKKMAKRKGCFILTYRLKGEEEAIRAGRKIVYIAIIFARGLTMLPGFSPDTLHVYMEVLMKKVEVAQMIK